MEKHELVISGQQGELWTFDLSGKTAIDLAKELCSLDGRYIDGFTYIQTPAKWHGFHPPSTSLPKMDPV